MSAKRQPLDAVDLELLSLCALDDWTAPAAERAWAVFRQRHQVNEQALLTRLYLLRLVDESNRLTFLGKVELWDAELRADDAIARMAS